MMFRVERRRSGAPPARPGRTIPALMDEAEKRGVKLPAQGRDRPAAEEPDRVARQRHPDEEAGRQRASTAPTPIELSRRRDRGPPPGDRSSSTSCKREAPGFADAYIVDIAAAARHPRDPAHHRRSYQLSGDDVLDCASFADTIGVNGWPIEKHVAGDVEWRWPPIPDSRGFNHLPYRMLLPQTGASNLLVAGRCASMTHEGQSAARVSGACFVMGQAAGAAAHLALAGQFARWPISVEALQDCLRRTAPISGATSNSCRSRESCHEEASSPRADRRCSLAALAGRWRRTGRASR